jgi:hypothetical protein
MAAFGLNTTDVKTGISLGVLYSTPKQGSLLSIKHLPVLLKPFWES